MNQKMFSTPTRVLIMKCGKHPKESVKDIWERIRVFELRWCSEVSLRKQQRPVGRGKKSLLYKFYTEPFEIFFLPFQNFKGQMSQANLRHCDIISLKMVCMNITLHCLFYSWSRSEFDLVDLVDINYHPEGQGFLVFSGSPCYISASLVGSSSSIH